MEESPYINDPHISDVKLITPKPILMRLDVFPFVILYAIAFAIYSVSTEEWVSLIGMILFPITVFLQAVVALIGYWNVPLRLHIAYHVLDYKDVMTSFKQFSPFVFQQGIEAAEGDYSSSLRSYQLYYTIYSKTLQQLRDRHNQAVRNYNPNNPSAIPPGEFTPPSPPTVPERGLPFVYYKDQPLSICIVPQEQYGSPLITKLTFDSSPKDRVNYTVVGGQTPEAIQNNTYITTIPEIKIHTDGMAQPRYPPITFSYHHAKYVCDPASLVKAQPAHDDHMGKDSSHLSSQGQTALPSATPVLGNPLVFQRISYPDSLPFEKYFETPPLLSSAIASLLGYYGRNSLSVPIPSYISLFIENAMSPFFIFQIICILLWCLDEYWYYSLFTLVMIVGLELVVVYKRRSQLAMMLGEKPALPRVYAYRNEGSGSPSKPSQTKGQWQLVSTQELVPTDIVCLSVFNDSQAIDQVYGPRGSHATDGSSEVLTRPQLYSVDIPCDMVLLNGGCVCDEAMLTGESIPQVKEDLLSLITESSHEDSVSTTTTTTTSESPSNEDSSQSDVFSTCLSSSSHKRHHLYGGTKIIGIQRPLQLPVDNDMLAQYKSQWPLLSLTPPPIPPGADAVLCRVLRTNFATTQGSLVRTILTASGQKLVDKEALLFILCLLCCAIVSAYYVLVEGLSDPDRSRYKLLLNVITILTSVVPPELPMELSMAVTNALQSLAKAQVFCTDPNRIPNAGKVNVCCFDKTGTLTSDTFLLTNAIVPNYDDEEKQSHGHAVDFVHIHLDLSPDAILAAASTPTPVVPPTSVVDAGNNTPPGDGDHSSSSALPQLDCTSFPIDVRLILGTAHELTMLHVKKPQSSTASSSAASKTNKNIRIVGNPMESVALSASGFQFNTQTDRAKYGSLYCTASPVELYPATDTSNRFLPVDTKHNYRIDADVIHRFTFSSALQRMSSVILVSPAKNAPDATESPDQQWLNATLPTSALRQVAKQTYARVVMKGSPECIYSMLHPDYRPDYEEYTRTHKALARRGVRVLALAWKPMLVDNHNVLVDISPHPSQQQRGVNEKISRKSLKIPSRDVCESGMFFAGIIGFTSPLKTQSKDIIRHLHESNHRTMMITGDHLLTAVAVAKDLGMAADPCWLLRPAVDNELDHDRAPETRDGPPPSSSQQQPSSNSNATADAAFVWLDEMEQVVKPFSLHDPQLQELRGGRQSGRSSSQHTYPSLCMSGDVFAKLHQYYTPAQLAPIISEFSIFARTLPHQKEMILKYLTTSGYHTVMCGDGTNDVGALTHADIGIALLSVDTDNAENLNAAKEKLAKMNKNPRVAALLKNAQKLRENGFISQAESAEKSAHELYKKMQQAANALGGAGLDLSMDDDEDDDDAIAKLGDASLAASFTAKHGSIRCVVDVIRQGRCALSTTGQMYQILALQCLVAAYSLAALYFQGVRQSESQMTVGGMISAVLFMLLARAQPLDRISPHKPNSRIFSLYNITTILLQFVIHLGILMYLVHESLLYTSSEFLAEAKVEGATYIPSVLNSTVFILSTSMTAATILANYVGYPFMTPLTTTPLFKILIGTIIMCVALSFEYMPEINELLEMAPMPNDDFTLKLSIGVILDAVLTFIIAFGCRVAFGIVPLKVLMYGDPSDLTPVITTNTPLPLTSTQAPPADSAPASSLSKKRESRKTK